MKLEPTLRTQIDLALAEDVGSGDLTSNAIFPKTVRGRAILVAKEDLVVSSLAVAAAVFQRVDRRCRFTPRVREGAAVKTGRVLAEVVGPLRALLAGERTALNFVRHLSGVATATRAFVAAIKGTRCTLLDTRKTTPGMRALEKAAVRAGGGRNHRMGLHDAVLIKDNHIAACGSITAAVSKVRAAVPRGIKIEVETTTLAQVQEAIAARVDQIMLDNMTTAEMTRAVKLVAGRIATEASGRITLATIRAVARTGVTFISVGAITHSARAADLSMEILPS